MRTLPVLRAAGLLAAFLALAAPAAAQDPGRRPISLPEANDIDDDLTCPSLPLLRPVVSRGGVLRDTLTMAAARFSIGADTMTRNVYNGQYNAPLYRLSPTDSVNILVRNRMTPNVMQPESLLKATNQHFHGFVVTPLPTAGDNVIPVTVAQGQQNRNNFWTPGYQAEGMMWYHPHPHGMTSTQVNGGLAGAMIVGDLLRYFPDYARAGGANERVMYIKDTQTMVNGKKVTLLNIMGNRCTRLFIRPGQMLLWRIANMSANTYVNLKLADSTGTARQPFVVLAWDGNRVKAPMTVDSLFIPPGSRAEVVVTGWQLPSGVPSQSVQLISAPLQTYSGGQSAKVELGWLTNNGLPVAPAPARLAGADAALTDSIRRLVAEDDVNRFTLRFQLDSTTFKTILNGREYDHDYLNVAVPTEQVQEWTLINQTDFLHTFHIHQTDFVVTHINGVPQPDSVHLDNVNLGIHRGPNGAWLGDTVVVRFKFKSIAQGPFVYHCHVLAHEDQGMMGNICVYDPANGVNWCRQWFPTGPDAPASGGHAAHAVLEPPRGSAAPHGASGGGTHDD